MAAINVDAWIPEETSGPVIRAITQTSVVERAGFRTERMANQIKEVLRDGGFTITSAIAKGTAYTEDSNGGDVVTLNARKIPGLVRLTEEDLADTSQIANIIQEKQTSWASSAAVFLDHSAFGVSAVANGTTKPFNSVYFALTQTNAATGYTANANLVQTVAATPASYADLSGLFRKVEDSAFYDPSKMTVVASPAWKGIIRDIKDTQNRPIFLEATSGTNVKDKLFGIDIEWTLGARLGAVASSAPSGNALLFVGNKDFLIKGDRMGPEYMISKEAGFTTDEVLLKMRMRRGWVVANEKAWCALEQR